MPRKELERRLMAQVVATEEAQQRYAEAVRQPPSPFPTPAQFRAAREAAGLELPENPVAAFRQEVIRREVAEIPFVAFRQEVLQREREAAREVEPEEFGEFKSSTYDDLEDYDYDDFFDDVGAEDEDSYGEDAA